MVSRKFSHFFSDRSFSVVCFPRFSSCELCPRLAYSRLLNTFYTHLSQAQHKYVGYIVIGQLKCDEKAFKMRFVTFLKIFYKHIKEERIQNVFMQSRMVLI